MIEDGKGKALCYGVWDQGKMKTNLGKKKYESLVAQKDNKDDEDD